MADSKRTMVVISYCRKDAKWLERLQVHLKPLEREGLINLWDDTRSKAGDNWREEIERALDEAAVVVFLMSADFLASDFVHEVELPKLLKRAKTGGVNVLPVIIGPCLFERSPLASFHALNAPDRPLSKLEEAEYEEVLVHAARAILAKIGTAIETTSTAQTPSNVVPQLRHVPGRHILTHEATPIVGSTQPVSAVPGIDLLGYLSNLASRSGSLCPHSSFVEPHLHWDASMDGRGGSTLAFRAVENWLTSSSERVLILLGDYGTGKSTLLNALAARYADQSLRCAGQRPFPIHIELRTVRHCKSVSEVIRHQLSPFAGPHFDSKAALQALDAGRAFLLLDGLDEMIDSHDRLLSERLLDLTLRASAGAKVALTCRTHYFRTDLDAQKAVLPASREEEMRLVSRLYLEVASRRDYRIAYLRGFDEAQVDEYLQGTLGGALEWVKGRYPWVGRLKDLLSRPILLSMIAETAPLIETKVDLVTEYDLYDLYTRLWIDREAWRESWTTRNRLAFACQLSTRMFLEDVEAINWAKLFPRSSPPTEKQPLGLPSINSINDEVDEVSLLKIEADARTSNFLIRDSEGNYRFAHRSFREFFLAQQLIRSISAGNGRQMIASFFPRPIPWNTARFLDSFMTSCEIDFASLLPDAAEDNQTFLMIDDSQYEHRDDYEELWHDIGEGTTLVLVPDSITGILFSFYIRPCAIMHDGQNIMAFHKFIQFFKKNLSHLGIPLALHHASLSSSLVAALLSDGTIVAEVRKPFVFDSLGLAVRRCLDSRNAARGRDKQGG